LGPDVEEEKETIPRDEIVGRDGVVDTSIEDLVHDVGELRDLLESGYQLLLLGSQGGDVADFGLLVRQASRWQGNLHPEIGHARTPCLPPGGAEYLPGRL
jgi:hypothetical protein